MATKVLWLPTEWFTEQWHLKCKHTWTLYLLASFSCCSPKFFGITGPSPSLLGALLVCFRAMRERSWELYFSVYIYIYMYIRVFYLWHKCSSLFCNDSVSLRRLHSQWGERVWLWFYWTLALAHLVISFIKGLKFLYTGAWGASLLLRVFCTRYWRVHLTVAALVAHWCSFGRQSSTFSSWTYPCYIFSTRLWKQTSYFCKVYNVWAEFCWTELAEDPSWVRGKQVFFFSVCAYVGGGCQRWLHRSSAVMLTSNFKKSNGTPWHISTKAVLYTSSDIGECGLCQLIAVC